MLLCIWFTVFRNAIVMLVCKTNQQRELFISSNILKIEWK